MSLYNGGAIRSGARCYLERGYLVDNLPLSGLAVSPRMSSAVRRGREQMQTVMVHQQVRVLACDPPRAPPHCSPRADPHAERYFFIASSFA